MRSATPTANTGKTPTTKQMVLVVAVDGSICDVLQAPDTTSDVGSVNMLDSSIDSFLTAEQAERFKKIVKRTVRSRQVQSIEHIDEVDDSQFESIFVPHGRDRALVVIRDISEQKNNIEKMRRLAYSDDVTKLPNREFLLDELQKCTEKLRLTEGRAAVLCFEIDQVDTHGNAFTSLDLDAILKELAARLIHGLRGANQSAANDYERYSIAARIDYRRFGVVLPCIEDGTDAEGVAERLSDAIQQPIKIGVRKVSVMARTGISLFPQDGLDADTLFENGIVAMEDASSGHAAPVKFHSGTVKLRALQRQDMEHELKAALDREEFDLNFLPIVEPRTERVVTVEALLRWPQTILGSQSIQKTVSIAERTGLILPIGDWVLRRSCEDLCRWHDRGFSDLRIAVNLSAQEFSRADLVERMSVIFQESTVDPEYVDLEINEYMLFRDAMKDYATCTALRELGVRVVIDDYGTGACSLAHLSRSPVNAIKIDNSFVTNSETVAGDRLACAAITTMAHELGMSVIAEGVETKNQATMLRQIGCDYLQGFLFCEPCTAVRMTDHLTHSNASTDSA